ncbi:MAG: tRNA (cytidine(34)-2'-O)-methyltransferase [Cardiobacteriaceae bacterium]|nr:tRNA (cytidine(34)-2'-O)-methyltransferase [Cardiobacteriaceae bacterium]
MFDLALFQPAIAQNTGSIIRLCANTGARLHLIHPMCFGWDDKKLIRAGLDYHEFAEVKHHEHWAAFYEWTQGRKIWAMTTRGERSLFEASFSTDDILLFGSESSGLSEEVHGIIPHAQKLKLPMVKESRSLNLSNAASVVLYEAIRQQNMPLILPSRL